MRLWPNDFDAEARGFDLVNVAFLVRCAHCAYFDDPIPELERLTGLREVRAFRSWTSDAEGFAARAPRFLVLAFRGSESAADWRVNLDARMIRVPWAPGRVHRGFAGALDDVWPRVARRLRALRDPPDEDSPPRPLWLTGHSLGGALASLAAARLEHEGTPAAGLATFGQPRVGDWDFVQGLRTPWLRVVHGVDAAAGLPVGTRPFPYVHGGDFVWLHASDGLDRQAEAWARCLDRLRAVAVEGLSEVGDHAIERYCDRLDGLLDVRELVQRHRIERGQFLDLPEDDPPASVLPAA
jgi:triacylglycerol lipase